MKIIKKILVPRMISLFSGWGGGSWGFHNAGFHEVLAVDKNKHSRECFRLNFPDVPIEDIDLLSASGNDLLLKGGLNKGELDLLLATPPCQGISRAGKFVPDHPLNALSLKTIELINEIQPKVFVFENVSSIDEGRMKLFFHQLMKSVTDMKGYVVDYQKLNAIHYGVPQKRLRFIMVGVRNDIGKSPVFPEPVLSPIHVKDILPDMGAFSYGYQSNPQYKTSDGLMVTITKTENVWAVKEGIRRPLTSHEVLKLCGYPEDWKTTGSRNQIWQRAGNSLMPKMAEAIAKTIIENILLPSELRNAA